jgi:hypothetical protein
MPQMETDGGLRPRPVGDRRERGIAVRKGSILVVALASVTLVGGLNGVAFATEPTITPVDDSFSFTSDLCPFPVHVTTHEQGIDVQYYDASGDPTSEALLRTFTGRWTNRATGAYLVERSRLRTVFPEAGGFLEIGLNFHIRLPSGRTVLIDAGKLFFDDGELVFEAGKHQVEEGDIDAFCAALR